MELATKGPAKRYISQTPEYLRVEISRDGQNEIDEVYRSLAVICILGRVRRVLLVAERDHASGEHVLREAFSAMLLAGLASDFRLAFVAAGVGIADRYRQAMGDLQLAGVETKTFEDEDGALRWLMRRAPKRPAG